MPAAETQDLRGRNDTELREDLESAHESLFNLRFQAATRQLADNSQVHKARRRIARIRTLLRERQILAEADAAAAERGNA
jgi:large subunit ribosomal protein L29